MRSRIAGIFTRITNNFKPALSRSNSDFSGINRIKANLLEIKSDETEKLLIEKEQEEKNQRLLKPTTSPQISEELAQSERCKLLVTKDYDEKGRHGID